MSRKYRFLISVIIILLALVFIGIQALRYTPHGWLTWRTAVVLTFSNEVLERGKPNVMSTDAATVQVRREGMESANRLVATARPSDVTTTDFEIPGPNGPIRVRLYDVPLDASHTSDSTERDSTERDSTIGDSIERNSVEDESSQPGSAVGDSVERNADRPLLVYYHGGGHVVGSIETHDHVCAHIAHYARAPVLSVEYRLAPEHPFPQPVQDANAAYAWALQNTFEVAPEYGNAGNVANSSNQGEIAVRIRANPRRIFVGGDSAGGNLAAAVALRDRAGPGKLAGQ
ncbi:MAG: alpha/beta hydrolase fold domain-containing protein, partial [Leptospiraceae bacterium]|nr:alpha/beta hydrolase fold domain-containing protein [Leptospiraceae bacterium]